MFDYGEFCPISLATSVLCERWTLQIVREMLLGASRFSEFQSHMPRLSPSLLKTRLRFLEEQDIVFRKQVAGQRGGTYHLTPRGKALEPVLSELGKWGMYWMHESITDEQLNATTLMRDISAALDVERLPGGESLIQVNISDIENFPKQFIRVTGREVELCEVDTGHEVDVYITGSLKTLTRIWYGDTRLQTACDTGELKVVGSPAYTRSLPRWFRISTYSNYNRNFLRHPDLPDRDDEGADSQPGSDQDKPRLL